jgi:FtsP/CotA-like multicopper oxidase with cupredoxin domain
VEITFLNHVDVSFFVGSGSFDNAETGTALSCDAATEVTGPVYPAMAGDSFPNCFHGSSTANLHFHGTHVTPDGLGDNVLLQLRPNPNVTEASVRTAFAEIFSAGMSGQPPARWSDLPKSWRDRQLALLKDYDDTAVWKGKHGTPGNPALPLEQRLLPQTLALIRSGHWPQYQIGAYPYCFKLTEYTDRTGKPTGHVMGQSPGTHWYHAHKHGSTALNVFNGMAGVFVIEGYYDDALAKIYPDLKKTEKVLIVQQFSDLPNLERRSRTGQHRLFVNGQLKPTITMRKGEIQLWRLVNATVKAVTTLQPFDQKQGKAPEVQQTAQDGVQFHYVNYKKQPLLGSLLSAAARPNFFAPGNRIDILVKAPDVEDSWDLKAFDSTNGLTFPLVTLTVKGDGAPMELPTESNYPAFPSFLEDIDVNNIRIWRKVEFGWESGRQFAGPSNATGAAAQLAIDGKQFGESKYDQTMVLGDSEEWKLTNRTSMIAHPFHIHVNPFQVVEIYDPAAPENRYKPEKNFVWQDTIAIPPSVLDGSGNVAKDEQGREQLGYVVIRHRFVDFPGSYVLHCHMLAHEDRGMMQLVRVIPRETVIRHH